MGGCRTAVCAAPFQQSYGKQHAKKDIYRGGTYVRGRVPQRNGHGGGPRALRAFRRRSGRGTFV